MKIKMQGLTEKRGEENYENQRRLKHADEDSKKTYKYLNQEKKQIVRPRSESVKALIKRGVNSLNHLIKQKQYNNLMCTLNYLVS